MDKKKFKALEKEWYQKLKQHGFDDIEYSNQYIKQQDPRTIKFQNQERIREYFLRLDTFLVGAMPLLIYPKDIPILHRKILAAYSDGSSLKQMISTFKKSNSTIRNIIRYYKTLITSNDFPQE